MTMGSPILKDFVPTADGIMVERLRKAGAIFIGKTNTPEFGLGSHTYNPVYGATRNAYDQTRSAGGSSGGAAVALALRMLPVADGSDYGGSLRNPAGWNNVFGFRTSFGRVPADGRDVWLPSMGVPGPMARNVADLALLLSVQAGYDARAPLSLARRRRACSAPLERRPQGQAHRLAGRLRRLRALRARRAGGLQGARSRPSRRWAASSRTRAPDYPLDAVWQAFMTLRAWQRAARLLAFYNDPAKRALLKPEAIYEIESGLKLSAFDITAASARAHRMVPGGAALLRALRLSGRADRAALSVRRRDDTGRTRSPARQMQTYHEWMKGVLPITMAGCPALAVPAGFGAAGPADRHPDRRPQPRRAGLPAAGPRLCCGRRSNFPPASAAFGRKIDQYGR